MHSSGSTHHFTDVTGPGLEGVQFNNIDDAVKDHVAESDREYELVDLQSLMDMDHAVWGAALTNGGASRELPVVVCIVVLFSEG